MTELRTQRLAFEIYPEDWVGRTILRFADGTLALDSSLTGKERLARGNTPTHQHRIEVVDTGKSVCALVDKWCAE